MARPPSPHPNGVRSAPLPPPAIHRPSSLPPLQIQPSPLLPQTANTSNESSGTLSPSARMLTTNMNTNANGTGGEEGKKERRRVQWAQAVGADGEAGGGGDVKEEGDAQDKRDRKARQRKEDERLTRELDERGLDRAAFTALRLALQSHQNDPVPNPSSPCSPPEPQQLLPDSDVYIPPDQTFGLPAPEPSGDAERGESGAAKGWGWVRAAGGMVGRHRRQVREREEGDAQDIQMGSVHHHEKPQLVHRDSPPTPLRSATQPNLAGRGVLASLLALYDPSRLDSGLSSSSASVISSSEVSTPDSEEWARNGGAKDSGRRSLARVQSAAPSEAASELKRPSPTHAHTHSKLSSLFSALGPATPPAARSSAGVLGSLITTTANLSGAAAPLQSSIAPQPTRSGFHVARYDREGVQEEEEIDIEEERRRVREERRRSWASGWGGTGSRPGSRGNSRPGSAEGSEDERTPLSAPQGVAERGDPFADVVSRTTTATSGWSAGSGESGESARTLKRANWPGALSLPHFSLSTPHLSPSAQTGHHSSYFMWKTATHEEVDEEEREKEIEREVERRKRRKAKKRRKESEIFITMHVAALLQRQEFLLKLARALMMFGAPTHRLEPLIQATARVLDMSVSCVYLPSLMLLSFNDESTRTSETKFLKQPTGLDLGRLQEVHRLYDAVIHDRTSVRDASDALDTIMRAKARYRALIAIIIGGLCSAFITPISFSGSFLDAVLAFPLGCLLVLIQQLAARNELFTHVFEIVVALVLSFISAALASTQKVCYAAVASGSVVLILPGYIVLTGALELMSRNIISGSVRTMYSLIYSLFLGFGLAIGAELYTQITGTEIIGLGVDSGSVCADVHDPNGPWWQQPVSMWWAFLCVPGFSFALSLRNQAAWKRKEFPVMILISCAGWTTSHFASLRFVGRSDVTAMFGALVVGVCGNMYGRFFANGMAFVVMVTGVLFQVPSSITGLLSFAALSNETGQDSYSAGFSIAEQLIEVSIGLTVGLFLAAVITHPFESRKRGAGLFSF